MHKYIATYYQYYIPCMHNYVLATAWSLAVWVFFIYIATYSMSKVYMQRQLSN